MTKQDSDDRIRALILATKEKILDVPWTDYDDPTTSEDDDELILRCEHVGIVTFLHRYVVRVGDNIFFRHVITHFNPVGGKESFRYEAEDPLTDELWDVIREYRGGKK